MNCKKRTIVKVFGVLIVAALCFSTFIACGAKKIESSALKVEKMVAYWESNADGEFALELKDKQTGEKQSFTAAEKKFDLKPYASAGRDFTLTVSVAGAKSKDAMSVDFRAVNVLQTPTISVLGNKVSWNNVRGASGYRVQYGNETVNLMNIITENSAADIATSFVADVKEDVACDVTVTAIGDGITYGDSEKSETIKAMFRAEEKLGKVENLRTLSQDGFTFLVFDAIAAVDYVVTVNDYHFYGSADTEEGVSSLTVPVEAMVNFKPGEYKVSIYARTQKNGKWINGERSDEITVNVSELEQLKNPLQSFMVDNRLFMEIDKDQISSISSILVKMKFYGEDVIVRINGADIRRDNNFLSAAINANPNIASAMDLEIVLESESGYKPSEAFKVNYSPKQNPPTISIEKSIITISGNSPTFKVAVMATNAAPTSANYKEIQNNDGKGIMNFTFKPGIVYIIYVKNDNGLEYKFNHRVAETPILNNVYASMDYSKIIFKFTKDHLSKAIYSDKGEALTLQYIADDFDSENFDTYSVSVEKIRSLVMSGTKNLSVHNVLSGIVGKSEAIEIEIGKYAVPEVKQSSDSIYWSKTININADYDFYGSINGGTAQNFSSSFSISENESSISMNGVFEAVVTSENENKYSVSVCEKGSVNYSFTRLSKPAVSFLSDNRDNPRLIWDERNSALSYSVKVESYNKAKDNYESAYPVVGSGGAVQTENYFDLGEIITEKGSDKYRVTITSVAPNRLSSFKTVHEVVILNDINVWFTNNDNDYLRKINYESKNASVSQKYEISYSGMVKTVTATSHDLDEYLSKYGYSVKMKALGDNYNYISSKERAVKVQMMHFSDIINANIISPRFVGSSDTAAKIYSIVGNTFGALPYAFDNENEYNLHNWTMNGNIITKDTVVIETSTQSFGVSPITLNANQFFIKMPSVTNYPSVRIGELNKEVGVLPVYTSNAINFDCWTAPIANVTTNIIPTYKVTNLNDLEGQVTLNSKSYKVLVLTAKTLSQNNYSVSGTRAYSFVSNRKVYVGKDINTVDLQNYSSFDIYVGVNVNSITNISYTFTSGKMVIDEHNKNFVTKGKSIYKLDGTLVWTNK